jgi:hypothetical protein
MTFTRTPSGGGGGRGGAGGSSCETHDRLIGPHDKLTPLDLSRYAEGVGLDTDRFWGNCAATNIPGEWQTTWRVRMRRRGRSPTFFIKAKRHHGAYDVATLTAAVRAARAHGLSVWRHAVVSAAR